MKASNRCRCCFVKCIYSNEFRKPKRLWKNNFCFNFFSKHTLASFLTFLFYYIKRVTIFAQQIKEKISFHFFFEMQIFFRNVYNIEQMDSSSSNFVRPGVTSPLCHNAASAHLVCFLSAAWGQCKQKWWFIGLWATFQILWQQLFCPNLPHS